MKIRKFEEKDIPVVLQMIEDARENMKKMNLDQWQDGSPNESTLRKYLKNGNGYISEEQNAFGAVVKQDVDYKLLLSGDYVVFHTFVVDQKLRGTGLSNDFFEEILKIAKSEGHKIFALDTHRDNKYMLRFIRNHGFIELGSVMINGTKPRIAFYINL